MKKGWYILNYHNISWEENLLMIGIGSTIPPDLFRAHVEKLSRYAKLVSIDEGFKAFCSGRINEVLVSFWFDDGYVGVRKYAFPILKKYQINGAIAVNSKFYLRQEMFWRCKLSVISQVNRIDILKRRLDIDDGYRFNVRKYVFDKFSKNVLSVIDDVYCSTTDEAFRNDAFRIFDTIEGIKKLYENGWEISNHTASHYPISEKTYSSHFKQEFEECELCLDEYLGIKTRFWVIPFDRKGEMDNSIMEMFDKSNDENRSLVLTRNKYNKANPGGVLYRIIIPNMNDDDLIRYLKKVSNSG